MKPQYPLWMGLPAGSALTRAELARRVDECTGVAPAGRAAHRASSARSCRRSSTWCTSRSDRCSGHLNWATWGFQDIVQHRAGGLNPFGNLGAHYAARPTTPRSTPACSATAPTRAAVARFAADADLGGRSRCRC